MTNDWLWDLFVDYLEQARRFEANQTETLWLIYCAGHGMMKNTTRLVLNIGKDEDEWMFDLEYWIRLLGEVRFNFTIGIFDCCRSDLSKFEKVIAEQDQVQQRKKQKETRQAQNLNKEETKQGASRDLGGKKASKNDYRNTVLVFGCPPEKTVKAWSTIAVEFFEIIQTRSEDRCIDFPEQIA